MHERIRKKITPFCLVVGAGGFPATGRPPLGFLSPPEGPETLGSERSLFH